MQGSRYTPRRLLALGVLSALGSLLVTWLMASYIIAWPVSLAGHILVALVVSAAMVAFTVLSGASRRRT
jgi:hypothetical protein